MKTWPAETYNNNHLRLMRFHRALAIFYACTAVLLISLKDLTFLLIAASLLIAILLHGGLAFYCKRKSERARKISEFVGMLMLFGFPIGTIIGYYLLQRTYWAAPQN